MDSDANTLEQHWDDAKAFVRSTWTRLTVDDVRHINGNSERLAGRLVSRYGCSRAHAHAECHAFVKRFAENASAQRS
ncbi:MAG TPA: hypothetical protein VK824_10255 [Planctomycetota bacterium]|nr:hypothetical protein [Planctomycetota bacterium]